MIKELMMKQKQNKKDKNNIIIIYKNILGNK